MEGDGDEEEGEGYPLLGESINGGHGFGLDVVLPTVEDDGVAADHMNRGAATQPGDLSGVLVDLAWFAGLADDFDGLVLLPVQVHVEDQASEDASPPQGHVVRPLLGHLLHVEPFLSRQLIRFGHRALQFRHLVALEPFNQSGLLQFSLRSQPTPTRT